MALLLTLLLSGSWVLAYWSTHPVRVPTPRLPPADLGRFVDVTTRTADGVRISGWMFTRPGAQAVLVLCHGHQFNRTQMLDVLRGLDTGRFSFVVFDFRCAGRSGGNVSTIGYREVADLRAVLDWLNRRTGGAKLPVGVFGLSMGGACAIMAAAVDQRIGAVVTQGAYASLDRAVQQRARFLVGLFGPALALPASLMGRSALGVDPADVSPVRVIGRISPRPVMICHGLWDPYVSPEDAALLYRAAHEPKTLRLLPRSWHIGVAPDLRGEYHADLVRFFTESLATAPRSNAEGPPRKGSP